MSPPRKPLRLIIWLSLFSTAFGYIEAAVVVYLRQLYYPEGFCFPLVSKSQLVLLTELGREAATLVLLLSLAHLAVRRPLRRFAVFAYAFAIWDLTYYLVLKLILDWPASFLEWDILFLIPVPWTAPVLAPILVSTALIAAAVMLLQLPEDGPAPFQTIDWAVEIVVGLTITASFWWNAPHLAAQRAPVAYPWWLFLLGLGSGVGWFAWKMARYRQQAP